MTAAAILDFQNYFLNVRTGQDNQAAYLCQILSKSLQPRLRYRDFLIFFKMVATAILDFKNFTLLTVGTVKKVEPHQCAKFDRNRSNLSRDSPMVFFWIFQNGGGRHLGFSPIIIIQVRDYCRWSIFLIICDVHATLVLYLLIMFMVVLMLFMLLLCLLCVPLLTPISLNVVKVFQILA